MLSSNSVFGYGGIEEKRREKDGRNLLSTVWLYKREEKWMRWNDSFSMGPIVLVST